MAGITLAQAEAQLTLYLAAEEKVLLGQSYELLGRRLTRADLADIQAGIKTWNDRVTTLSAVSSRGGRSRVISPNW